jgi:hypothetical protein
MSQFSQNAFHNQSANSQQPRPKQGSVPGGAVHQHNISNHNMSNASVNPHKNENILCAVLALIKELNEGELELIKRDIDKKLAPGQQKSNNF